MNEFIRYGLAVFGLISISFSIFVFASEWKKKNIFRLRIKRSAINSSPDLSQRLMQSFSILGKTVVLIEGSLTDVKRLKEIDGHPFRIVLFAGAGAILSLGASVFLTHSLSLGIMAAIIGAYATLHVYMQIKFQRYSDIVLKSFPSAIDGLIRCLKAGFDLSRSLTIVSDELPRELQYEFKIMIRNRNLGQSLGDAMYFLASRLQSREAMFLATLIAVQEKTGGPLVHALESLSQILKDRERLRQKRLVASAEARMSAMILGGLPVAVALLLFATNPSYRDILLETQTGRAALILGVILLVMGSIVMHRMIRMPSS